MPESTERDQEWAELKTWESDKDFQWNWGGGEQSQLLVSWANQGQ